MVADDTDYLVSLLFHYKPNMGNVFMQSEVAGSQSDKISIVSIHVLREKTGNKAAHKLLVVHSPFPCLETFTKSSFKARNVYIN